MNQIMIDIETLSTQPNAAIASIGAVYFDKNGPVEDELGDRKEFHVVVELSDCISSGLHVDGDTLKWWLRQNDKARSAICDSTHSLLDALIELGEFIEPHAKVWGNGADFDLVILKSAYTAMKLDVPWSFKNVMCFRTLKNLFPKVEAPESFGTMHNALDDAIYQANHYAAIINRKTKTNNK